MTAIRLIAIAGALVSALSGNSPQTTSTGLPIYRIDAASLRFVVNRSTAAGMVNLEGAPIITESSDPLAALKAAAASWTGIPGSTVKFLPLEIGSAGADPSDGVNTIVFADSLEARSIVGPALAVTALVFYEDGEVLETDIIFNPAATFSTNLAPKTYDLQSVAAHEFGHALGANHSGLLAATMFQGTLPQTNSQTKLSADDLAYAAAYYPSEKSAEAYCVISGRISLTSGDPIRGALLVAYDPATNVTVGGFSSLTDGTYSFKAPRGSYLLYAEPLDGPVAPENLSLFKEQVDRGFQTNFFGGIAAPQLVDATLAKVTADISVAPRAASFDLQLIGTGEVAGSGDAYIGPGVAPLTAGQAVDLVLYGPGLASEGASYEIRMLGPGIVIRPDSLRIDRRIAINETSPLRITVDVAERAEPAVVSVIVVKDGVAIALSGSLLVTPAPPKTPLAEPVP